MKYKIEYLPIANNDISEIINYIANHLNAPKAAMSLLDTLDNAIIRLEDYPYAYKVYHPVGRICNEYRMIPVKDYAVFYTVNEQDKIAEIHRVVYAKMDLTVITG